MGLKVRDPTLFLAKLSTKNRSITRHLWFEDILVALSFRSPNTLD